ncbi:hypothetical protein SUGI_0500920 [Cryptomeria japonica]|nr:hypothetical protein SUGI_0500920 [Cryptomeria japonica]
MNGQCGHIAIGRKRWGLFKAVNYNVPSVLETAAEGFREENIFAWNMGKKIMEMKRIEDTGRRKATFRKRKKGLLKKAEELSILCDAQVAVTVCSETGNVSTFSSHE